MRRAGAVSSGVLFCLALAASAQQPADTTYSRRNTFSGFFEYSNDSSHIILGDAENRKIGAIGFQYQRRLVHRRPLDFSFIAEARPGMIESDPTEFITEVQTQPQSATEQSGPAVLIQGCHAGTYDFSYPIQYPAGPVLQVGQVTVTCGRRTVVEQGFSPVGLRINLMPRHRLQPTFSSFGGYMFATQPVPIPQAGSFNFTFEFGGGLEYFTSHTRSIRLEYQVQHFSNKKTADLNPGVDSGFIKLTYAFGH
jgi:hypothetical protein